MATRVDTAKDTVQDTQAQYFRVTDQVPEEVWYWAALGSIIVSASLFLMGKRCRVLAHHTRDRPHSL